MKKLVSIFILLNLSILTVVALDTFVKVRDTSNSHLRFENVEFQIEEAFPNLTFSNPVGIYHSNDDSNRLFVVDQEGIIYTFNISKLVTSKEVFLDISDKVLYGGEQGLLGLAFHPNYSSNGYFYLNYISDNPRRTIISRFSVMSNDSNQANQTSEFVILEVNQPFSNHNGGQIAFGPDKFLYIALGDGGSGGDPLGHGQNRSTLLGSILRLDVDNSSDIPYSIPKDNPFSGNINDFREEIYAYGLRNPWRFSFDFTTGDLWAADVGQNKIEEIDIITNGGNYGWNTMEGSLCYSPSTGCDQTGLITPIIEYGHDVGNSIIGGYVYRGSLLSTLSGFYIYADYGSGRIWALKYDNSTVESFLLADTSLNIVSFGVDIKNELYICALDGKIHEIKEIIYKSTNLTASSSLISSTPLSQSTTTTQTSLVSGFLTSIVLLTVTSILFLKQNKKQR